MRHLQAWNGKAPSCDVRRFVCVKGFEREEAKTSHSQSMPGDKAFKMLRTWEEVSGKKGLCFRVGKLDIISCQTIQESAFISLNRNIAMVIPRISIHFRDDC